MHVSKCVTKRAMLSALSLAMAMTALPAAAQAAYTETVFFGDSLTDSGFYRPFLVSQAGPAAASLGRFSTNPGLVWSEFLADYYGTDASPAWQLTTTGIVAGTGENYAAGGARVALAPGYPPNPPTSFAPSLTTQVNAYLAAHGGQADAGALYTVWGGPNDLFFHLQGLTTQAQFLGTAGQQVGLVSTLGSAGAQYIVVPTMPDVGTTPFGLSQGAARSAGITALVQAYNQTLFGGLEAAGQRVIPVDTYTFLHEVQAAPALYGFRNVTQPACGATSSLICSPLNYAAPDAPEAYVFADGVHPSTAGHRLLAQYAASVLEGPRLLAILPHSASIIGRGRADQVSLHRSGGEQTDGLSWWGNLRGDSQRYKGGDLYDGIVPAGLFGIDWARDGLVLGAFGGYGQGKQDFGLSGGDFEQKDTTLGGFFGWYGEKLWANAQASYSWLGFDIDRKVQLGPATRSHTGSPDGSNLSVGASVGYDFGDGALRHGPVLGVLSQQIKVDGYAESNAGSTALIYPDQEFDSLVGSAGWQFRYESGGVLSPYARLTYDREFEDSADQAYAQLQSMPGLSPYAVPGQRFDQSYTTVVLGARGHWAGLQANVGLSASVDRSGGHDASVFAGLSGSF